MIEENKTLCEPLKYKQLRVKALLLTEIIAFRRTTKCLDLEPNKDNDSQAEEDSLSKCDSSTEIFMHNGIIYSSQRYNSGPDPDMSDIAIKFYEILYGRTILNKNNGIDDKSFAGDTMNSYNSVAKVIENKGTSISDESKRLKEEWKYRYHCLANFWLIPSVLGRSIKNKYSKGHKQKLDSLDLFLYDVNNSEDLRDNSKDYFHYFNKNMRFDYDTFLSVHYLSNYEPISQNNNEIKEKYNNAPDEIIKKMIECIELRADNTVRNEEVCNELYDFFKEKKLL